MDTSVTRSLHTTPLSAEWNRFSFSLYLVLSDFRNSQGGFFLSRFSKDFIKKPCWGEGGGDLKCTIEGMKEFTRWLLQAGGNEEIFAGPTASGTEAPTPFSIPFLLAADPTGSKLPPERSQVDFRNPSPNCLYGPSLPGPRFLT